LKNLIKGEASKFGFEMGEAKEKENLKKG